MYGSRTLGVEDTRSTCNMGELSVVRHDLGEKSSLQSLMIPPHHATGIILSAGAGPPILIKLAHENCPGFNMDLHLTSWGPRQLLLRRDFEFKLATQFRFPLITITVLSSTYWDVAGGQYRDPSAVTQSPQVGHKTCPEHFLNSD